MTFPGIQNKDRQSDPLSPRKSTGVVRFSCKRGWRGRAVRKVSRVLATSQALPISALVSNSQSCSSVGSRQSLLSNGSSFFLLTAFSGLWLGVASEACQVPTRDILSGLGAGD